MRTGCWKNSESGSSIKPGSGNMECKHFQRIWSSAGSNFGVLILLFLNIKKFAFFSMTIIKNVDKGQTFEAKFCVTTVISITWQWWLKITYSEKIICCFRYLLGKYYTDSQKAEFLTPTVESLALETKIDRLGTVFYPDFPTFFIDITYQQDTLISSLF